MTPDEEALYQRALALVLEHAKASTSWLQRQLRVGYNSAARMIERMQAEGAVSGPDHIGRREVLRPPSSILPGSSIAPPVELVAAAPLAAIQPDLRVLESLPDGEVLRIASELVSLIGLEGARRTVRSVAEARGEAPVAKSTAGSTASHLEQIVERAERLFDSRYEIAADIRDLFKFAKDIGLDPTAIRACIKARAMDTDTRFQAEATLAIYRHALGIEDPDFAIELPPPAAPPPPRERKLTAKEKAYQETLASVAASRAILVQ